MFKATKASKQCGHKLTALSGPGGIELPPKVCIKPLNHPGNHSDGSASWIDVTNHMRDLETRNVRPH